MFNKFLVSRKNPCNSSLIPVSFIVSTVVTTPDVYTCSTDRQYMQMQRATYCRLLTYCARFAFTETDRTPDIILPW